MIPHKLQSQMKKIHNDMFNPSRMKLVVYDTETNYDDWLQGEQLKCGDEYAYLFVLKLRNSS